MRTTKQIVDEDYEREWLKDHLYIGEEEEELYQWWSKEQADKVRRSPIFVLKGEEVIKNGSNKKKDTDRSDSIKVQGATEEGV